MAKKRKVGILFGGRSAEHEVSLRSAKNIIEALDKKRFEPILIGIDKKGGWYLNAVKDFIKSGKIKTKDSVVLVPGGKGKLVVLGKRTKSLKLDVVFPILHGPFGEDGTVQGLLKLGDVPFVGPSVLGSAVGMDKEIMKRVLHDSGLPIGKFLSFKDNEEVNYGMVVEKLGLPMFVKPANLGSSVGISKVRNNQEFEKALKDAFLYDHKIIIEEFIEGREIECAVLGNDAPEAAIPGEVAATHEFYSYEAKYLDENGAVLEVPAKISADTAEKIKTLSISVFKALCCEGLGRVDFFLKKNGEVLVNEINTIPGFTSISMFPRMWGASGVSYTDLISKLLMLAIERFKKDEKLKTSRT